MTTRELAKMIADGRKDTEDLKPQFGAAGSVTSFFNIYQQTIQPEELYTIQNTRTLGSSFILGHTELGVLGVASPQPYLGDSRGDWVVKGVFSPNDTFKEFFAGSRFKA